MSRLLLIGLDGADLDVVRPFAEAGHLPHLHDLMKKGPSGLSGPPIRPCLRRPGHLHDRQEPGKHGVFDFTVRKPDSYEVEFVNAASADSDHVRLMSDAGKRSAYCRCPSRSRPRS